MQALNDLEKENKLLIQHVDNLTVTLDHIGAYVFTKDLEGKYTFVNQLVRELFDCPVDEIIGFDDSKFFSLELSNDLKVNDQKVMRNGEVIENIEKNIIAKTGETRYFISVKKPLFDHEGNVTGMFGVSTDITERKRMEQELQTKQELLDSVLNNVDAFIYMKDTDYRYLYINPQTAGLFEMKPEDVLGKQEEDFMPKSEAEKFREMDKKVFLSGEVQSGEEQYTTPEGKENYYWSVKVPLKDSNGEITSYIGISTDITEVSLLRNSLLEKNKLLEEMSIKDNLTKLYNRYKLNEVLMSESDRALRYDHHFSVILLDIDHFKHVNDTHGHNVGDQVLIALANILTNKIRSSDVIGRWGGEEFLIICPETDLQGASQLAENLRQSIEKNNFPVVGYVTSSFGAALFQKGDNPETLVAKADIALYQAKESGRNKVVISKT